MIAPQTTLGDVLNALADAGIEFDDADDTGFNLNLEGKPVRVTITTEPSRLTLAGLDAFALAAAEFEVRRSSC